MTVNKNIVTPTTFLLTLENRDKYLEDRTLPCCRTYVAFRERNRLLEDLLYAVSEDSEAYTKCTPTVCFSFFSLKIHHLIQNGMPEWETISNHTTYSQILYFAQWKRLSNMLHIVSLSMTHATECSLYLQLACNVSLQKYDPSVAKRPKQDPNHPKISHRPVTGEKRFSRGWVAWQSCQRSKAENLIVSKS